MESEIYHIPALLAQSVEGLDIRPDGIYADVTFGGGGHSRAILSRLCDKSRKVYPAVSADIMPAIILYDLVVYTCRRAQIGCSGEYALPRVGE